MFQIIKSQTAGHSSKKGKITCSTCQLKGCVGRCHWETVGAPKLQGRKAA